MICILSPAKTMIASHNISDTCVSLVTRSLPMFSDKASVLGKVLKKKTKGELKSLCGVSDALSTHVKGLYNALLVDEDDDAFSVGTSRYNQSALMFDGPAFRGLAAKDVSSEEGAGMQKHLRILTGLYGYVKPGDLIQEHRLCMGTKVIVSKEHKDLYQFWGVTLAEGIIRDVHQQLQELQLQCSANKSNKAKNKNTLLTPLLINCASQEYSKSILPHLTAAAASAAAASAGGRVEGGEGGEERERELIRVVECVFLDGGIIKSAFAKRARGLMSRFVCTNQILHGADSEVDKIKLFDYEGYRFAERQSSRDRLVFTRAPGDIPSPASVRPPPKSSGSSSASSSSSSTATASAAAAAARKRKASDDKNDDKNNDKKPKSAKKAAKKTAGRATATATVTTAASTAASGPSGRVTRASMRRE